MDHAPAQLLDTRQRPLQIGDAEVREREGIARSAPALMDTDREPGAMRLPALTLPGRTRLEVGLEQAGPEAPGPGRIVGGKLNQCWTGGQVSDHSPQTRPDLAAAPKINDVKRSGWIHIDAATARSYEAPVD